MRLLFIYLLVVTFPHNSFGFSSVIGNQSRNGYDVHSQITHPVLDKLDFSYISFREVISGNVSTDYYKNLINDASRHCDRNIGLSHKKAFLNCRERYHQLIYSSIKEVKSKKYLRSLYLLGQALHVAQDLISHSNISLLENKEGSLIVDFFLNPAENKTINLKNLKITFWDKKDIKNTKSQDRYSHKEFSLDHPHSNKWCKNKNEKGSTYFKLAMNDAKKISKKVITRFLSLINKRDEKIIKNYNL